ncbi:MAG: hypothetical protein L0Y74_02975 [candidate division Zixibacteria bacterium]|nr:hypothetical protein [candidate division Zixibacteria bacterium]
MSKKLVAAMTGWLLVLFMLFATSAVWSATKDGSKATNKGQNNPQAVTAKKSYVPLEEQDPYFASDKWVTQEEGKAEIAADSREDLGYGSVYEAATGTIFQTPFFSPGALVDVGFDNAGTSYYDLNANDRNPRQIAINQFGDVMTGWAKGSTANITGSEPRNQFATMWVGGAMPLFSRLVPANPVGRGGFGGADYVPRNGKFIVFSHRSFDALPDLKGSWAAIESGAGTATWTNGDAEEHFPDSSGTSGSDPGIWPSAAGGFMVDVNDRDGDASTTDTVNIVHMTSNAVAGAVTQLVYSRAVETAVNTWNFPGFTGLRAMKYDSSTTWIPATVVSSKKSPRVALIYTAEYECNFEEIYCSDLYLKESFDGGEAWVTAGSFASFPSENLTNYDSTDLVRARPDLMGVYDRNDSLVISYSRTVTYDPVTGSRSLANDIMVWTRAFGHRKAVDGNFDQIPAGVTIGQSTRKSYVNWPHIAVHDGTADAGRTNYLYLVYTQYGGNDAPSYNDTSIEGNLNGEIYVAASTNGGNTWSKGLNITNSKTPACAVSACSDIEFSSVAERANDTLHILAMSDTYTGNLAQGINSAAQGTDNPIVYFKYPAFNPPADTLVSVSPSLFPAQNPASILSDTFAVQNTGNQDLTVSSITHDSGWLDLLNDSAGFAIAEGGADKMIAFTVNDAGKPDGFYVDTIRVNNNSENRPVANVVVRMVVDNVDPYVETESDTLENSAVKLTVTSFGSQANQSLGMRYIAGGDTVLQALFEGSSFLAAINPVGDTVSGNVLHEKDALLSLAGWKAPADTTLAGVLQKPGTKVKIPAGLYHKANARYAAFRPFDLGVEYPGPWFGFTITDEWFLPKASQWDPRFVLLVQTVQRVAPPSWWPTTTGYDSTETMYFGNIIDWDAFTTVSSTQGHTAADNYAGVAPGTGVAWQQGSDTSDTYSLDSVITQNDHFAITAWIDSLPNIDPFGMHIVGNPSYLYAGGNFAATAGAFLDKYVYEIAGDAGMEMTTYFHGDSAAEPLLWDSQEEGWDSLPTDVNTFITNAVLNPPYSTKTTFNLLGIWYDTSTVLAAGATADDPNASCKQWRRAYHNARQALGVGPVDTLLIDCLTTSCVAIPGDANASNSLTLGDVIATVNYVFNKPGFPACPANNKDCWLSNLLCRGDWNASSSVTLSDVIQGVNKLFNKPGGPWDPLPVGVCCSPLP